MQGIKNVVLVHGAWADGSSWSKLIPLLQAKGLHAVAAQNPLSSIADGVASTNRLINAQDGPGVVGWAFLRRSGDHGSREQSEGCRSGLCRRLRA
jgi:hypothetical protein